MTALTATVTGLQTKKTSTKLDSLIQVFGSVCLLAILAQISIPLPFSPVPLTGQTFGVLLVGAMLGSRRGVQSILTYIAAGCAGLPVFAGGGAGILSLIGPMGGYFLGFVLQAFLVGWILERRTSYSNLITVGTLLVSCALQLLLGSLWLAQFVGWPSVLFMGFYPFVPGEILKSVLVAAYLQPRHD